MSLENKLENAKSVDWLSTGLNEVELTSIKQLALISAKIEMKRSEMKMSQKEFAKFMGVSQTMVSKWESGEYNFSIGTLVEICDKLDFVFEPLIRDKNEYEKNNFEIIHTYIKSSANSEDAWNYIEPNSELEVGA